MSSNKKVSTSICAKSEEKSSLASLCATSIRVMCKQCKGPGCTVDANGADPKKPFKYAVVIRVSQEGFLTAEDVYLVPVDFLSSRTKKVLNFDFAKERTTPFIQVELTIPEKAAESESEDLTGDACTLRPSKTYPTLILALGRCRCGLRSAWTGRKITIPQRVGPFKGLWTTTSASEGSDMGVSYSVQKRREFFPDIEMDTDNAKKTLSQSENVDASLAVNASRLEEARKLRGKMEAKRSFYAEMGKPDVLPRETSPFTPFTQKPMKGPSGSSLNQPLAESASNNPGSSKEQELQADDVQRGQESNPPNPRETPKDAPLQPSNTGSEKKLSSSELNVVKKKGSQEYESSGKTDESRGRDNTTARQVPKTPDEEYQKKDKSKKKTESDSSQSGSETPRKRKSRGARKKRSTRKGKSMAGSDTDKSTSPEVAHRTENVGKQQSRSNTRNVKLENPSTPPPPVNTPQKGKKAVSFFDTRISESEIDSSESDSNMSQADADDEGLKSDGDVSTGYYGNEIPEVFLSTAQHPQNVVQTNEKPTRKNNNALGEVNSNDSSSASGSNIFPTQSEAQGSTNKEGILTASKESVGHHVDLNGFVDDLDEGGDFFDQGEFPYFFREEETPPNPDDLNTGWNSVQEELSVAAENPELFRSILNRTKGGLKMHFANLCNSIKIVEKSAATQVSPDFEEAKTSLQVIIDLAFKRVHPGGMEELHAHANKVMTSWKKSAFMLRALEEFAVKCQAREAIVNHVNQSLMARNSLVSELTKPGAMSVEQIYKDFINEGNYEAMIDHFSRNPAFQGGTWDQEMTKEKLTEVLRRKESEDAIAFSEKYDRSLVPWDIEYYTHARDWNGNFNKIDKEHRLVFAHLEDDAMVRFEDTRRHIRSGNIYRFMGNGLWIYDPWIRDVEKYFKTAKKSGKQSEIERKNKALMEALVDAFFEHGKAGLEHVNFYKDNMNPLTARKIALMREFLEHLSAKYQKWCVENHVRPELIEETSQFPDAMLSSIAVHAAYRRVSHIGKGSTPIMVCAGMFAHPANFISFFEKGLNKTDGWYEKFFHTFENLTDGMKQAIVDVQVRGRKAEWSPLLFIGKGGISQEDGEFVKEVFKFTDNEYAKFESSVKSCIAARNKRMLDKPFLTALEPKRWARLVQQKLIKRRTVGKLRAAQQKRRDKILGEEPLGSSSRASASQPSCSVDRPLSPDQHSSKHPRTIEKKAPTRKGKSEDSTSSKKKKRDRRSKKKVESSTSEDERSTSSSDEKEDESSSRASSSSDDRRTTSGNDSADTAKGIKASQGRRHKDKKEKRKGTDGDTSDSESSKKEKRKQGRNGSRDKKKKKDKKTSDDELKNKHGKKKSKRRKKKSDDEAPKKKKTKVMSS